MKKGKEARDPRITRSRFSWPEFIGLFFAIQVITAGAVMVVFAMMGLDGMPPLVIVCTAGYCVLMTLIVCALTALGRRRYYERPMRIIADAARQVAQGDFSVQIPVKRGKEADYVDVMYDDFNTMVEELRGIEALKDDFVGNVSHEIKTPLSTIQNYADALTDEGLATDDRVEYAQAISGASRRLTALVTNILKLNKLENQVIVPEAREFDLAEQLRGCVLDYEDVWEAKGIRFVVDVDDSLSVTYDAGLLEIVWGNLIANAVKFTDRGGTVTLTERADSSGICVTVEDTGLGMDEDTKNRIFDKFYQGDTSHAQEGNGLGLALAAKALTLAGGEMIVTSTPGEGSTFSVWLRPHS